jgi:hypothetical protein
VGLNLKNIRRAQLALLLIWTAIALSGPLWWGLRLQKRHSYALYASARGGDLDAVRRLAQRPLTSVNWLQELAQDQNATADSRVEAINTLAQKNALDSRSLSLLLWIDQPLAVRHAVALAFEQHGCDNVCVGAALNALDAIWKGEPTLGMRLSAQLADTSPISAQIDSELHRKTVQDYLALLNLNPCLTRQILNSSYPTDHAFVDRVHAQVEPC